MFGRYKETKILIINSKQATDTYKNTYIYIQSQIKNIKKQPFLYVVHRLLTHSSYCQILKDNILYNILIFYNICDNFIRQMQLPFQNQSPTGKRKGHMFTISSLNKAQYETEKNKSNRTVDYNSRQNFQSIMNTTTSMGHNQLISTKIINVQLQNRQVNTSRKNKSISSNNKIYNSSLDKCKSNFQQKNHQIYRRGRNGVKVIAKYKHPLSDDKAPMKRYIKIQKIQLPNFDLSHKSSAIKMSLASSNNQIADSMKKTIEQYSKYLEKKRNSQIKSSITKTKIHRRNHSSIINKSKGTQPNAQDSILNMKTIKRSFCIEDFPVRRPLGRKDYFVFGMTDRNTPQNKVQYYRDFLWKINFSNGLHVQTPDQIPFAYKAFIGPGNNSNLVKSVLKRRFWWTIMETNQSLQSTNFLWTQLKLNNYFAFQQKSSNQLIFEQNIESPIIIKRKSQTALTNQDPNTPSQQDSHKKLFSKTDLSNWMRHASRNEKTEQKINQMTYIKRLSLFQNKFIRNIQNSNKLKIHNHLESNFFIGNKKALFYNMRMYLRLKNVDPFSIIPLTFHICKGIQDNQFKVFKKHYEDIEANRNNNGLRNIWIVKPGQNTNRGNGITVAYSIDDITVRLKGRQKNGDGKLRTFIIQKYIQRPLLYCKRKFDIRHYLLITCINGIFKGYWYEQGYIRTSSSQFTTKYSKDPFVHLTNDAIQKNGANYGRYEKGNKLSYQDFQKYLDFSYRNRKISFFDNILPQMKDIATQAVRATYALLDQNRRQHNFQLLGLDFMIDEDFKPWLIEVNTNPCLELSCSLLQRIIPNLIDNVFKLCIDPLFPPPQNWQTGKKLYFGDSPLNENKFQIIFDEADDGMEIEKLYEGGNKLDQKMGKIQQDDQIFEDDGDEDWQNNK